MLAMTSDTQFHAGVERVSSACRSCDQRSQDRIKQPPRAIAGIFFCYHVWSQESVPMRLHTYLV